MLIDPATGEIRDDPTSGPVDGVALAASRVEVEDLVRILEVHGDELDRCLDAEEVAENAYNHRESMAMIRYVDQVPATILGKYVRARCDAELAAWTSAKFATKRARARVDQTKAVLIGEQSILKYKGSADGGVS